MQRLTRLTLAATMLAGLVSLVPAPVSAQGMMDRIKKKAEEAAKRKVEKRAGEATDAALDKAECKVPGKECPVTGSSGEPSIKLAGSVGGVPLSMSGARECGHSPEASIYGVASSMWMVSNSGTDNAARLSATIWRPKSGAPDQVQLNLKTPSGSHEIDTVTGDKRTAGSASVSIDARASGGRIVIDGRDAKGVPIRIEVDCSSFSAIQAVGG